MSGLELFTFVHVLISLIAIATGIVVLHGMLSLNRMPTWTMVFLATTGATSITGFMFPFNGFTPAIAFGILSVAIFVPTLLALYVCKLKSVWRWIYVVGVLFLLYLNTFVLVVQSFLKIPALNALAPKGTEPPFAIAQGIVLILFIAAGIQAVKRFRPIAI
jgi:hypothetical protein